MTGESGMLYQIIYADCPHKYKDKSKSHGGGAESHYPCMSVEELCSLPIKNIAENDSVLLFWTTMPMLEVAFPVIKAWGFTYKTCAFTWIKENKDGTIFMGMGRHTRQNPELLLLATRGRGLQRISKSIKNPQFSPRLRHSEKPEKFRRLIEELYGDKTRIELFARSKRLGNGWDCWGNEVESDIEL